MIFTFSACHRQHCGQAIVFIVIFLYSLQYILLQNVHLGSTLTVRNVRRTWRDVVTIVVWPTSHCQSMHHLQHESQIKNRIVASDAFSHHCRSTQQQSPAFWSVIYNVKVATVTARSKLRVAYVLGILLKIVTVTLNAKSTETQPAWDHAGPRPLLAHLRFQDGRH